MTLFQKKLFIAVSISLFSIVGVSYWIYSRAFLSTDNAYINANIVQISPRISGQVRHVYVSDNQFVKEGQLLFDIDPIPYEINISEARAQYDRDSAQLYIAQITAKRTLQLVEKKVAAVQEGDVAKASLQSATAALELSKAHLEKAILDLQYAKVTAPTSGWITNMTLRSGNMIIENQPLFALISNNQFWVDANFKETNLSKIHPGQKVDVRVDMYPNHLYAGIVDSISGGSGTAFSLLPPQNATGNWVKVTQRVPVRINLTRLNPNFPLRIGTSAVVTIHLKQ
ncbi:MAG: HlyD family secretion protein [Gammaproteobacteria bacterium]|nr:HlyD family secretion protein [Gammaproteobacteria bacterium]